MEGGKGANPSVEVPSPQCIVWHAPDRYPPSVLRDALERRGIEPRQFAEPHAALAALCITAQEARRGSVVIFLVVEPEGIGPVADVVEAVRVYAPGARLWLYSESEHDQLRQITDEDVIRWGRRASGGRERPAVDPDAGPPKLKLVDHGDPVEEAFGPDQDPNGGSTGGPDEGDVGHAGADDDAGDAEDPNSLLTDDELSMLLDDDPPDEDDR